MDRENTQREQKEKTNRENTKREQKEKVNRENTQREQKWIERIDRDNTQREYIEIIDRDNRQREQTERIHRENRQREYMTSNSVISVVHCGYFPHCAKLAMWSRVVSQPKIDNPQRRPGFKSGLCMH